MLQASTWAVPPALRIVSAVAEAADSFMSKMATGMSSSASRRQMARPMPLPPPVTIATFFPSPRTKPPHRQSSEYIYGSVKYGCLLLFLDAPGRIRHLPRQRLLDGGQHQDHGGFVGGRERTQDAAIEQILGGGHALQQLTPGGRHVDPFGAPIRRIFPALSQARRRQSIDQGTQAGLSHIQLIGQVRLHHA